MTEQEVFTQKAESGNLQSEGRNRNKRIAKGFTITSNCAVRQNKNQIVVKMAKEKRINRMAMAFMRFFSLFTCYENDLEMDNAFELITVTIANT